ncbi:MAG: DUF309 domain-containing protein [Conexivisphaera sp.]
MKAIAQAAGLRVIDVRLDVDHSEVDVEGQGMPEWECEVLDVVDVGSLEHASEIAPLRRGLELMSSGRFWEAHEVLESVWHSSTGPAKDALGFLIKCCAAAVHLQRGGYETAVRVASRAASVSVDNSCMGGMLSELRSSCASIEPGSISLVLREFAIGALGGMVSLSSPCR